MTHRTRNRTIAALACGALPLLAASQAGAQPYLDGRGKEWRQLKDLINLTWDQVAQVCPTDGSTPCSGSVNSKDLTGWTWATPDQVARMFARLVPEIMQDPSLQGPQYTFSALVFLSGDYIDPTYEAYTTFGGYLYVGGWTSQANDDGTATVAYASVSYPVYNGAWNVDTHAAPGTPSIYNGVWLWRPGPGCAADYNYDGFVDGIDSDQFNNAFEAGELWADFNYDGFVDGIDSDQFNNAFEIGC